MREMVAFHPRDDRQMAMLIARLGGATLEQIGAEFGVTRERVRQLLQKAGWENRGTGHDVGIVAFGMKNGQCNVATYRKRWSKEVARDDRRAGVAAKWKQIRREQVRDLKALAQSLSRIPTLAEFAQSRGYASNQATCLTVYWATYHRRGRRLAYTDRTKRLYRAAGFPAPLRGTPGHVIQTDWKAERRRMAMMVRWAYLQTGKRPTMRAVERAEGLSRDQLCRPFAKNRSWNNTGYATARKRLFRAAGLDRPYGFAH